MGTPGSAEARELGEEAGQIFREAARSYLPLKELAEAEPLLEEAHWGSLLDLFRVHLSPAQLDRVERAINSLSLDADDDDPDRTPGFTRAARSVPAAVWHGNVPLPEFPGYQMRKELARGGMGIVYEAYSEALQRPVALKVLSGAEASSNESRRFRIEAMAAARLDHPNVVRLHGTGEHGAHSYLVMDLVRGESLKRWLGRQGPIPEEQAARIFLKLSETLAYAHDRSVLHRDLKPSNILITDSGEPVITDFGLAKVVDSQVDLTRSGQMLGTPTYMPPEQARGDLVMVGKASDIYSLGATFYEMLAGRPPFAADSVTSQLVAVMLRDPEPPSRHFPGIHPDLDAVCLKCLEKIPTRRYATADELAEDLRRFLRGEPTAAAQSSTPSWREEMLTTPNEVEATLVCRSAAEGGDADAMTLLFHRLFEGIGCERDYDEATTWGERAAEQGQGTAMTGLGLLYELGLGVEQSDEKALEWYRRAMLAGDTLAIGRIKALQEHQRALEPPPLRPGTTRSFLTPPHPSHTVTEDQLAPPPWGPDPHERKPSPSPPRAKHFLLSATLPAPLPFLPGDQVRVGRQASSQIQVRSELISREHALFYWAEGSLYLRDQSSTNGTFLNGYLLHSPCPLESGDVVVVGDTEILVRSWLPFGEDPKEVDVGRTTRSFRISEENPQE